MNQTIKCGPRYGEVSIPSSKSVAHRTLICAALSRNKSQLICNGMSKDIIATINCLTALGASFVVNDNCIEVTPIAMSSIKERVEMNAGESGSTLRFIIPIIGALGITADIIMEGRLPDRPLTPFDSLLMDHGMVICKEGNILHLSGQLTPGEFSIPGNISSQFISGLLFSLPLLKSDSTIIVSKPVESRSYINLTINALNKSLQISPFFEETENEKSVNFKIYGDNYYNVSQCINVEGDWSNAAFFMCMGALSEIGITLYGLDSNSAQGDMEILNIIKNIGADVTEKDGIITVKKNQLNPVSVDVSLIPDLVPTLASLMAFCNGTSYITNAYRLRLKESDRLMSTSELIRNLGGSITENDDSLVVNGNSSLKGGIINSYNDHRIAMAAAVCAFGSSSDVIIEDSGCVSKSFPTFYDVLNELKEM